MPLKLIFIFCDKMKFRYVTDNEIIDLSQCHSQDNIAYTSDILCIRCNKCVKVYDIKTHKLLSTIDGSFRYIYAYYDNVFILTNECMYKLSKDLQTLIVIYEREISTFFAHDCAMNAGHMIILCNYSLGHDPICFEIFKDGSVVIKEYDMRQILVGMNASRNILFYDHDEAYVKPHKFGEWEYDFIVVDNKKVIFDHVGSTVSLIDTGTNNVIGTIEYRFGSHSVKPCYMWPSRFYAWVGTGHEAYNVVNDDGTIKITKEFLNVDYWKILIIPDMDVKPSRKSLLDIDGFYDIDIVCSSI